MKATLLTDRCVLRVAGEPARGFLNNLVTGDIATMTPDTPRYAALLSPQGKIVADFFVVETPDGEFLIDCPATLAAELLQKLTFYKLRARVTIARDEGLAVLAVWSGDGATSEGTAFRDPRLPALGLRVVLAPERVAKAVAELDATPGDAADYEAHRIALGVPQGGVDFTYGDAFPHDADMDKLSGVDFRKGCFVGQEVVSRVQHRGTARNRVVAVAFAGTAPAPGSAVTAGGKSVGSIGSVSGAQGLAMLRVDRVAEALAAGSPLLAGDTPLQLREGFADFLAAAPKATA
jgi:folate-binding protein YgfZ